jgi:hypothetical protein
MSSIARSHPIWTDSRFFLKLDLAFNLLFLRLQARSSYVSRVCMWICFFESHIVWHGMYVWMHEQSIPDLCLLYS